MSQNEILNYAITGRIPDRENETRCYQFATEEESLRLFELDIYMNSDANPIEVEENHGNRVCIESVVRSATPIYVVGSVDANVSEKREHFYLIEVTECFCGYEFPGKALFVIKDGEDAGIKADLITKQWRDADEIEYQSDFKEITQSEFNVLEKFLSVMEPESDEDDGDDDKHGNDQNDGSSES